MWTLSLNFKEGFVLEFVPRRVDLILIWDDQPFDFVRGFVLIHLVLIAAYFVAHLFISNVLLEIVFFRSLLVDFSCFSYFLHPFLLR